ncbi:MAG: putative septum site-determining protein MinC [Candidatus Roseilinea sp.]|nr:MAG: putative septum site-determining protein MinC [Candidatus Roseilinea sp.]
MIAIKGFKQGLLVIFSGPSDEPWLTRLRELEAKLSANPGFFKGGSVAFDVKGASLDEDDLRRSIALLESYEVTLWAVLSQDAATCARVRALGLADRLTPLEPVAVPLPPHAHDIARTSVTTPLPTVEPPARAAPPEEHPTEGTDGLLVRRRVRSGQVLRHPGHIVVIGDVNPGAQLIAGGDIIVWGKLQGSAHAGALGDDRAVICALEMSPSFIRIADATRTPRLGERRSRPRAVSAEMARIEDQQIVFVAWDKVTRIFE